MRCNYLASDSRQTTLTRVRTHVRPPLGGRESDVSGVTRSHVNFDASRSGINSTVLDSGTFLAQAVP